MLKKAEAPVNTDKSLRLSPTANSLSYFLFLLDEEEDEEEEEEIAALRLEEKLPYWRAEDPRLSTLWRIGLADSSSVSGTA
jgi:hypothetical protein